MPVGGHHRKADPKRAKQIKEGGKKADAIHQKAEQHHKKVDIPAAEAELLKDLDNIAPEEEFTPPNQ